MGILRSDNDGELVVTTYDHGDSRGLVARYYTKASSGRTAWSDTETEALAAHGITG